MDILVTYDIADTETSGARRLRDVAAICEGFGVRAQNSVFECRVSSTSLAELRSELESAIDPARDSVHIYRFSGSVAESRTSLGRVKHQDLGEPWIL